MAERPESPLRRRRHLRSDLQARRPPLRRRPMGTSARRRVLPGFRLTMGFTLLYLSLIVLVPLTTLPIRTATHVVGGDLGDDRRSARGRVVPAQRRARRSSPRSSTPCSASWRRGCWCGTDFPGRRIVDALIDLPFALPTAVAGITLTAIYAPNGWLGRPLDALRHQGRVHAARRDDRADLHRPAVRGPDAAAGHRGSRPRGRGGGHEPGRQPLRTSSRA